MKKYLSILLIVAALVVVPQVTHAGALEDLYKQIIQFQQMILQLISQQNKNSIVSQPVTTSWQTYKNAQYGFSIKYPTGYEIKDDGSANGYAHFYIHKTNDYRGINSPAITLFSESQVISTTSLEAVARFRNTGYTDVVYSNMQFDTLPVIEAEGVSIPEDGPNTKYVSDVLFDPINRNIMWGLSYYQNQGTESENSIFIGIMHSFRLLDERSDDTVSLKTYSNDEYKFSLLFSGRLEINPPCQNDELSYGHYLCDIKPLISFYEKEPRGDGSWFDHGYVAVAVSRDPQAVSSCTKTGYGKYSTATINGTNFDVWGEGDVALGTQHSYTLYKTLKNGSCYSIIDDEYSHIDQTGKYATSQAQADLKAVVQSFRFSN